LSLNGTLQDDLSLSYSIFLFKCTPDLIDDDEKCASNDEIDSLLNSQTYLEFQINLKTYNLKTQKLEENIILFYMYLDKDLYAVGNLYLI
jgi:hypothetical protein